MTPEARKDHAVAHALAVREAVAVSNFYRVFQLYESAPNQGVFLMNKFIGDIRQKYLHIVLKAYVTTSFLQLTSPIDINPLRSLFCGCKNN